MSTSELFDTFEANPKDVRAFDALVRALLAGEDREGLEAIYDHLPEWIEDAATSPLMRLLMQKARAVEDTELADWLHFRNGLALWRQFGEHQRAESCFRKIESRAPDPDLVREFYMGFYTAQKNWRRLEQFLTDTDLGPGEEPGQVKRTLGRLADEHGQPERAVTFWQAVRETDPLDRDANDALARLYPKVGKWHSMVDLLREQLTRVEPEDKERHFALFDEIIRIYKEELAAPSKVIGAWQSVLDFDPGNRRALNALLAEYEAMNRWPDVVRILKLTIESSEDTSEKISLHRRIATLMLETFSNAAEGVVHLEAILELDPADTRANATLRETYESRRDWTRFALVREREIELIDDPGARHEATVELATIASERVRQLEVPIRLWRQVLQTDSDHPEALHALEGLYERAKAWPELTAILERRAVAASKDAPEPALLERIALLYTNRLEDDDGAEPWWRALLNADPEHRKAQAEIKRRLVERQAWDELERFHRDAGSLEAWGRTLEGQAKAVEKAEDEVELLRRAAALWREDIVDLRRAMRCYDRMLELAPDDQGILVEAIEVYRGADAPKRLAAQLEALSQTTEDPEQRRQALLELSETRAELLHEPEGAFLALATLVEEDPGRAQLYLRLEDIGRTCGRLSNWAEIVESHLADLEPPSERVILLRRLGEAYRGPLANGERAVDAFERVLAESPDCQESLNALEELRRTSEDWLGLVTVLQQRIASAESPDARRPLRIELAEVLRSHLDRPADAAAILEEILEEDSDDALSGDVYDALVRIHVETGDAEALASALAARLTLLVANDASPTLVADHEVTLGMLAYATRKDRWRLKAAIDHYEAALQHVPGHRAACSRLEELLASEDYRRRVAEILEVDAKARGARLRVAESLEVQVVCALDLDAREDALALLDRLVLLYRDELQRWDEAWSTLMRLVALEPSREAAITDLEALTDELGRWRHVAALYETLADEAPPALRTQWLAATARTWHYRLGELDMARKHYEAMVGVDETRAEALEALEEIFRGNDRPEELLDILEKRLEPTSDVDLRVERTLEIVDLLQDRLRRYPEAIEHLLSVRDLVPRSEMVHERLVSLLGLTEDWERLRDTLVAYIDEVQDEPRRLMVARDRLAQVQERHLGSVSEAMELYGVILGENDESTGPLEAMERLFEDPAHAPRAAPILEPIYTRRGAWKKLIRVLEVRALHAARPADGIQLQERIAELYEHKTENQPMAFEHRSQAFVLDPARQESLDQLVRLADVLGNHEELMLMLVDQVKVVPALERQIVIHRMIASLARESVGDLSLAERHLEAVLALTEQDDGALDELIQVSRHTRDEPRLVELLVAKADVVADPDETRSLLAEASELASRSDDTLERAIELTERLHELDPTAPEPLGALEALYGRLGAWEALSDVLSKKLEQTDEVSEKARLGSALATLQSQELGTLGEAIVTWKLVLEWSPGDRTALRALDELYSEKEAWASVKEVLVWLQSETDELAWIEHQLRIAELDRREDRLDRPHEAIAGYAALLDRRPDHRPARDALRGMIENSREATAAFGVLEPVLANAGELEMLWHLHEVMAADQGGDDAEVRYETYREMARLASDEMGAPARAFEAWSSAFRAAPHDEASRAALCGLAEALGRWDDLVALLIEQAHEVDDLELERVLLVEAGGILERDVGDLDAAEAIYGRVVESHPDDLHALTRLGALYRSSGDLQAWIDTLARRCAAETDLERRTELLLRHGQAARDDLVDLDLATASYLEVLDTAGPREEAVEALWAIVSGGHRIPEITQRLRPLFEEQGAWDRLHAVLEMQLEVLDDGPERLALMDRLVEMNLEQLNRNEEALIWLGRATLLDPGDDDRVEAAAKLAAQLKTWEELNTILLGTALAAGTDERRIELWLRAADNALVEMEDRLEGERILRMVLEVDPTHEKTLDRLDELVSEDDRWAELEPVLRRQLEAVAYDEERTEILMRLGALYRDRLGRSEEARATFEAVIALDDCHRPALLALEVLTRDGRDHEALFSVLHRLAETAGEKEDRASRLAEMATIAERDLHDEGKAISLWHETISLDPHQPNALRELQRLAELQGDWEGVLTALEQEALLEREDHSALLQLYKRAARIIRDELGDPFRAQAQWQAAREVEPKDREALDALSELHRDSANLEALATILEAQVSSGNYLENETGTIWRELAVLYTTRLVDPARAIGAWQEVILVEPTDDEAVAQLEQLYASEGRWSEMVRHLRDRLASLEGDEKTSEWLRIAEIQRDRLADPDGARTTYAEILAAHPGLLEASEAMEAILRSGRHHDALAALLLDRVEHLRTSEERHETLRALAAVYLEDLNQQANAFLVMQKATTEAPTESGTRAELERLAAATGMWSDLVDTYDAILEHLEGDEARDLTLRAAEVVEVQLKRQELAVGYYGRALQIDPDHEGALRSMIRLCSDLERWSDLVQLLERLAERTTDYREQLELLHRLAEIQEQEIGDAQGAADTWYRVLENDPLYRHAIEHLERLHARLGHWEALIEVLERRTQIEPGEAVNIALRIGDVLGTELDRADDAIERYEDVLSYEPGHETALERLAAIHGERGNWSELANVYMRAFDTTSDVGRRVELARKVRLLHQEVFGDRDAVIAWCGRILELEPGDMETLATLEKLYREAEDWSALVSVLESTEAQAKTTEERVGALLRRARVMRDHLGDLDRACSTYESVLSIEPSRDEALQALEELYGQAGNWSGVVEVLDRKAALTDDDETRVELLRRQGKIADEKMQDVDRAAKHYERALHHYPGHPGVLRALIEIYERSGRYAEAVQVLQDAAGATSDALVACEIHLQLASIWRDRLANADKHLLHLEAAIDAHPEHAGALWDLSSLYLEAASWAQALPLLDVLIDLPETSSDRDRAAEIHKRLARCAEGVMDHERALDEYSRAAELTPDDDQVLFGLGVQSFKAGHFEVARETLAALLSRSGDSLDKAMLLQIHLRLGECATQEGDLRAASDHLGRVVEAQPNNIEAVSAVVDVLEGAGSWGQALSYLQRLVELQQEPIERSHTWQRMGDIQRERLKDVDASIQSYEAALGEGVFTRGPLLQLMQIYTTAGRFEESLECVERLLKLEEDPSRRALFAMSAAVICRDQLGAPRRAILYLDQVLDADPQKLEAFEALDALLSELQDWEGQAAAYDRMIARIDPADPTLETLRFTLHRNLGQIHHQRRMVAEDALPHLEQAATLRPTDMRIRETLAFLYEEVDGHLDRAAETHRALLAIDPSRVESYHRLFNLWTRLGETERAWCVAGLLVGMEEATEEETTVYERGRSNRVGTLRTTETGTWDDKLVGRNAELSRVFLLLYEALGKQLGVAGSEELGIRSQDRVDPGDRTLAVTMIGRVASALGVAVPDVYVDRSREGLRLLPTLPPAIGISPSMMTGRTPRELVFHAARALYALHPTRALAAVYEPERLETMLMAAMDRVCDGSAPGLHPGLDSQDIALIEAQVESIGEALDRSLTPSGREELSALLQPFARGQAMPDVGSWIAEEALARNHAALTCCGDVALALSLVRDDDSGQLPLGRGDQLRHLVSFAVSPEHQMLRAQVHGRAFAEDA